MKNTAENFQQLDDYSTPSSSEHPSLRYVTSPCSLGVLANNLREVWMVGTRNAWSNQSEISSLFTWLYQNAIEVEKNSHEESLSFLEAKTQSSAVPVNIGVANSPLLRNVPLGEFHLLEGLYEIRGDKKIWSYLSENQELIPLLKKIPGEVKHYFENIVKIILELRPDLDGNSPSELFVYIVTKNGADEAWKNMQALEEKWWFEEVGNNPVNIDVEFS